MTTKNTEDTEDLLVKNMEYAAVIRSLRANAREDAAMIDRLQRECDEARELCRELVDLVAYGLGQSGEPWSLDAIRKATNAIQNIKKYELVP